VYQPYLSENGLDRYTKIGDERLHLSAQQLKDMGEEAAKITHGLKTCAQSVLMCPAGCVKLKVEN
jgi:hypothetical protein